MKEVAIVVAIAENGAIGLNGELPWHLPNDLKFFKRVTTGYPIIMGRRTFESLPNGALPNRKNIVVSTKLKQKKDDYFVVSSIKEALKLNEDAEKVFFIGGVRIFEEALKLDELNRLYITWVHAEIKADTFFPELEMEDWNLLECERHEADEKNKYAYSFCIYEKK